MQEGKAEDGRPLLKFSTSEPAGATKRYSFPGLPPSLWWPLFLDAEAVVGWVEGKAQMVACVNSVEESAGLPGWGGCVALLA